MCGCVGGEKKEENEEEKRMKAHRDVEMTEIIKKHDYENLLDGISSLVEETRRRAARQVNTIIVQTYWEIGRLIVEEEQRGEEKADYGTALIAELSKDLTKSYVERVNT